MPKGSLDRIFQAERITRRAPGKIDNYGSVLHRVVYRFHRAANVASAGVVEYAQTHQTGAPHHAADANPIIPLRRNDAGDRCSVSLFVLDDSAVSDVVPTVYVAFRAGYRIFPAVVGEVWMC